MYNADSLLKKTENILRKNVYSTDKKYPWYPYRMVCPDKEYFTGVWNWDAAFHAMGFLSIDKQIAKEQILGFTSFQRESDGIFPDLISYSDGIKNEISAMYPDNYIEYRYTKPPVMADAAWKVYRETEDTEFLKTVYVRLVKNEAFWYKNRFKDGLFHYDADAGNDEELRKTLVGYESGMDNSPRWDKAPNSYYAIDLNCYMVTMYRALKNMAKELAKDFSLWEQREKSLTQEINLRLWDEKNEIYNDFNFETNHFGTVLTPVCFLPLYIKIAPKDYAEKCVIAARKHFLPGMPTVAFDDKSYSLDYWRGPCWLNLAYFAAKGFKNYGFCDEAIAVRDEILGWASTDGECVHENYDAKTGKGLYRSYFSWSCVFIRKFILDF